MRAKIINLLIILLFFLLYRLSIINILNKEIDYLLSS